MMGLKEWWITVNKRYALSSENLAIGVAETHQKLIDIGVDPTIIHQTLSLHSEYAAQQQALEKLYTTYLQEQRPITEAPPDDTLIKTPSLEEQGYNPFATIIDP